MCKFLSECRGKLWTSVRDKGIVETKAFKDMGKEKLGNAGSIDVFGAGSEDYPFVRPWSTTTIKESWLADGGRSVMRSMESCWNGRDEEEGMGDKGGHVGWWFTLFCWHMAQPETKALTKEDKPGHMFDDGFGVETPCMPRGGGFMQRADKGAAGCWWYIHLSFKVEAAILKGPVSKGRVREQGGAILYGLNCLQNKGVGRGRGFDMACEGEVKSLDDHWIRDNGDINVVISSVDEVFLRKGISGRHPCVGN